MSAPLVLTLPEPPSLNEMLRLAKQRTRRGPGGVWMREPQSRYWVRQQEYFAACNGLTGGLVHHLALAAAPPWSRWRIVAAHYRLHQLRDWLELMAGLKWGVDWLKHAGFVEDDSPRHLAPPPVPTQEVSRARRGVTLTISPVEG